MELHTQVGFFVQSILADRYIHRRGLRLVSLESLSSVEYGIKIIFNSRTAIAGAIIGLLLVFYNSKNLNCIGALSFFLRSVHTFS